MGRNNILYVNGLPVTEQEFTKISTDYSYYVVAEGNLRFTAVKKSEVYQNPALIDFLKSKGVNINLAPDYHALNTIYVEQPVVDAPVVTNVIPKKSKITIE